MNTLQKIHWKLRYYGVRALGHVPGALDGDAYYCNLCGKSSRFFLSYGTPSRAAVHMVGSGVRPHAECPRCFSHDRFRWVCEVILRYTDIVDPQRTRPIRIMHIAAEPGIKDRIVSMAKNCEYLTGDLERRFSDVKVDVTDMSQFENGTFDYFIMNHVLEHIPDEAAAMREIRRVLKPDGVLLISFPLCLDRPTFEDAGITTPSARRDAFGQEDHVRLYGTDSRQRLERYGFCVQPLVVREQLSEAEQRRMALIPEDTIFRCTLAP